jgi:uncharacterized membrane protein
MSACLSTLHHAERTVYTGPDHCAVVTRHGHGDQPDGNGTGLRCVNSVARCIRHVICRNWKCETGDDNENQEPQDSFAADVYTGPDHCAVVTRHGHGDQPDGNGTGLRCVGEKTMLAIGRKSGPVYTVLSA